MKVSEKISKKILRLKKNRNTTFQNLWDKAKAVLRKEFIVIQACLKKQEKSHINDLTFLLKKLEKNDYRSF